MSWEQNKCCSYLCCALFFVVRDLMFVCTCSQTNWYPYYGIHYFYRKLQNLMLHWHRGCKMFIRQSMSSWSSTYILLKALIEKWSSTCNSLEARIEMG